ncbi:hypothetical protein G6F68_014106 [Rhizopus microsporus]|nr:hypothetical protein G6F68_014106 [Rhizopus microsporus]
MSMMRILAVPAGGAAPTAAVDQRIQAFGQIRLLQRGLGQVEIDAGGIGGNAAPGHRRGHQRTQQVQTGVQAHQPVAARPVDGHGDAVADLRGGVAVQHVEDTLAVVGVDGVRQRQDAAVRQGQRAAVARLAAAARVADGLVQFDTLGIHGDDGGVALAQVGLVVESFEGGGHRMVSGLGC